MLHGRKSSKLSISVLGDVVLVLNAGFQLFESWLHAEIGEMMEEMLLIVLVVNVVAEVVPDALAAVIGGGRLEVVSAEDAALLVAEGEAVVWAESGW